MTPAFTRLPHKDQIAPATPADVVPVAIPTESPATGTPSYTPGPLIAGPESDDGVFGILLPSGHSIGYAKTAEDAELWSLAPELAEDLQAALEWYAETSDVSYRAVTPFWVRLAKPLLSKLKGSN